MRRRTAGRRWRCRRPACGRQPHWGRPSTATRPRSSGRCGGLEHLPAGRSTRRRPERRLAAQHRRCGMSVNGPLVSPFVLKNLPLCNRNHLPRRPRHRPAPVRRHGADARTACPAPARRSEAPYEAARACVGRCPTRNYGSSGCKRYLAHRTGGGPSFGRPRTPGRCCQGRGPDGGRYSTPSASSRA